MNALGLEEGILSSYVASHLKHVVWVEQIEVDAVRRCVR